MSYRLLSALIAAAWIAWLIYWAVSARNAKATARQESLGSRLSHIVPLVVGAILACSPGGHGGLPAHPIWPASDLTRLIGFLVLLAGLAFSVWARRHIGANWSATVTVKESHELVRSGPYAIVRHPPDLHRLGDRLPWQRGYRRPMESGPGPRDHHRRTRPQAPH